MARTFLQPFSGLASSFWFWAGVITLLHIVTLILSGANLGPDEAQYWYWSRDLDFGYFSKPPFIAWAIALTTGIFGNAEWAVRLGAPLFHLGAAAFLYAAAKTHFDNRIAFWAGLGWLTLPGVILSSFVMTTDAPLLLFWSGGLFFLLRLVAAQEKPDLTNFIGLGVMIGLGFLSKYAMLYFIASLIITAALSAPVRRALLRPQLWTTGAIALGLAMPNIVWNAANDFQTVAHTAANANWSTSLFKPASLASFLGEQAAVAGIVPFFTLVIAAIGWRKTTMSKNTASERDWKIVTLLVFALTPLIIVSTQSFISRAHANWAASAYPATVLLITFVLFQRQKPWLAKASIGLHGFFLAVFTLCVMNFSIVDRFGLSPATTQIRGWERLASEIAAMSEGYDAIVIDDRSLVGTMLYYQRDLTRDIVTIDSNARVDNHYEAFLAFDPARHKRVLFVTTRDDSVHVDPRFKTIIPLGARAAPLGRSPGGEIARTYHLFDIAGYYGPDAGEGAGEAQ